MHIGNTTNTILCITPRHLFRFLFYIFLSMNRQIISTDKINNLIVSADTNALVGKKERNDCIYEQGHEKRG